MKKRPTPASRSNVPDADDLFVEKTLVMSHWARRNTGLLVVAGVALVGAIAGGLYYSSYRANHLQRAVNELERSQQAVALGDTALAKIELSQYVQAFDNTPYADEARLMLGELYLESDQPDQAVEVLEDAADLSEPIGLQVAALMAKAREEQGDLEEAEALHLRVAEAAELDFQIRAALEDAARIRLKRGDAAGAAELYQRILDGMEETAQERGVYEMRLAEARTRAS